MKGTELVHEDTRRFMSDICRRFFPDGKIRIDDMEDLVLWTKERDTYPPIGTESTTSRVMNYIGCNADWINVCLFVNEDFRACFNDAIMIEKALLQVSDIDYKDFREDMVLASDKEQATDTKVDVSLDTYSRKMESILTNFMNNGRVSFFNAGMTEAYDELLGSMSDSERSEVAYIMYNIMYVVNAMTYNGVFNKYVRLVVDSVKKQLS